MTDATFEIIANADDGYARTPTGGNFSNSGDSLIIGSTGSGFEWHTFFRFQSVTIPKNATISAAILKIYCAFTTTATICNLNIHFEDADDTTAISSGADLVGRSLQSATAWNAVEGWTAGNWYDSPSLVSALQTHIDRAGWASGQDLTIHLVDNSSSSGAERSGRSRDYDSALSAELQVTYEIQVIPNVVDNLAVSESTFLTMDFIGELQAGQDIALIENVAVDLDRHVNNGDNIAVSENVAADVYSLFHAPQAGNDLAVSENFTVEIETLIEPSINEYIAVSEFTAATPSIEIDVAENLTVSEFVSAIEILAETAESIQIGDAMTVFNWSTWIALNKNKAIQRFYLTVTGAADGTTDIQIPISSFQARKRSGNPTYVSAVVPGFEYAGQISDRANGELVITLGYEIDGTVEFTEEILRVTLEEIRTDEGPTRRAISLSGTKIETFATQIATVENSVYRSVQSGNLVHRFAHVDPFLNPGDVCRTGNDEFTVDYIIYQVNAVAIVMEVREG